MAAILQTAGNDTCHVILRGGSRTGPNYQANPIADVCAKLGAQGLPPRVMVDCSHGNSQRDYRKQKEVASELGRQIAAGSRQVFGVMLESHLVEGRQEYEAGRPSTYGQSITDSCISIDETEQILERLALAQQARG